MRPNMIVGAICLLSAAAFAACQPSQSLDAAADDKQRLTPEAQQPAPKATVASVAPKKAGAKTATVSNAVTTTDATRASTPVLESHAVAAKQQEDEPIATTVTGCLVRDDGMFQLKDTDGQHAPKARSWKSGFIKKGSARIDLVDAANRLKLGSHVGYRVSVSGTLADREMHARSVRATSERCD